MYTNSFILVINGFNPPPPSAHAQGVIYSPTAAANYKSDDVFDMYLENIPARRVGYPEEVSLLSYNTYRTRRLLGLAYSPLCYNKDIWHSCLKILFRSLNIITHH